MLKVLIVSVDGAEFLNVIGAHEFRTGLGKFLEAVLVGEKWGELTIRLNRSTINQS